MLQALEHSPLAIRVMRVCSFELKGPGLRLNGPKGVCHSLVGSVLAMSFPRGRVTNWTTRAEIRTEG